MMKVSIQEDITILNIYVPRNTHIQSKNGQNCNEKQTNLQLVIVSDFSTPLSITDRTSRQETSKVIKDLNNTINQFDLIDVYRTWLSNDSSIYSLFKCTWSGSLR